MSTYSEGLLFTLNATEDAYIVTGRGSASDTSIIIPATYNDLPVTAIGASSFSSDGSLHTITLPSSITTIGSSAFYYCYNLTSIVIPDSVTTIGEDAFEECHSLTDVYYLGDIAGWCGITFGDSSANPMYLADNLYIDGKLVEGELVIPDSVTTIPACAFRGQSITSVVIPDSVATIGDGVFYNCTSLTSVTIGDSVTTIGSEAFRNCDGLTNIVIPDSVTSIGKDAFSYCTGLTSITIPDSVTSIGNGAFNNCTRLTNVTFGVNSQLTTINNYAFYKCTSLTSIVIPDTVTTIGSNAFAVCYSLTSIVIPDSVTTIGEWAFDGCNSLTSVTFGENSQLTSIGERAFHWCNSLTSITIPNSVTTIGEWAFYNCYSLTSITIPNSMTTISDYAFYNCSRLTSIVIPDSVTTIGSSAFYSCDSLTSIVIPDSVTSIGDKAFWHCNNLADVYFIGTEDQWKEISIGDSNDPLTNATIHFCTVATENVVEATCTTAGSYDSVIYSFDGIELLRETIVVPALGHDTINHEAQAPTCTEIGWNAYETCSRCDYTTYAEIPATGHTYSSDCDTKCNVCGATRTTSTAHTDVNPADNSCDNCGAPVSTLTFTLSDDGQSYAITDANESISGDITLPSTYNGKPVTTVGRFAFDGCKSLATVTFEENSKLTTIGEYAFHGCNSLTSITIPDTVTSIGRFAFDGCYRLVEVYNKSSLNIVAGSSDYGYAAYYALNVYTEEGGSRLSTDEDGFIIYADGDDKVLVGYVGNETELTIPNDVTAINQYAFHWHTSLTSITIPNSVITIGNEAFNNCTGLTSITIPDSVTSIGEKAFEECSSLTSVAIGSGVTTIGSEVFYDCSSLTSVTIGDSVTSIGERAFYDCSSLTNVTIGDSVTTIGEGAFSFCDSLTSIVIPDSVTTIGEGAFAECINLTSVLFAQGSRLITIGELAFFSCPKLVTVTLPASLHTLGFAAFGFTGLVSLNIPAGVKELLAPVVFCSDLVTLTVAPSNDTYYSNNNCIYTKNGKTLIAARGNWADSGNTITLAEGVETIDIYAIVGTNVQTLNLPRSLTAVKEAGVTQNTGLVEVNFAGTSAEWAAVSLSTSENDLLDVTIYTSDDNPSTWVFYPEDLLFMTDPEVQVAMAYPAETFRSERVIVPKYCEIDGQQYSVGVANFSQDEFPQLACLRAAEIESPDTSFAFLGCERLCNVKLPAGLTTMPVFGLLGLPELKALEIPASVTTFMPFSVSATSIRSLYLPKAVSSIRSAAFIGNESLDAVVFEDVANWYSEADGSAINVTDPARNASRLRKSPIQDAQPTWIKLTTEGDFVYTNVDPIADTATLFRYQGTSTDIIVPSRVTRINTAAFKWGENLESISFAPDTKLTSLADGAFADCVKLKNVVLPGTVTRIESNYTIVGGAHIGQFAGTPNLEHLTLPFIGDSPSSGRAFEWLFGTTDTSSRAYLADLTVLGGKLIQNSISGIPALQSLLLGAEVSVLRRTAINNCPRLTTITFDPSNKLGTLEQGTFRNCTSLQTITLPVGIHTFEWDAFLGCTKLIDIHYTGTLADWCKINFYAMSSNPLAYAANLYIDSQLIENELKIPADVTVINPWVFERCLNVTKLTLSDNTTSIGACAFHSCTNLTEVTLGSGLQRIDRDAFLGCTELANTYYRGTTADWCSVVLENVSASPCYHSHDLHIGGQLVTEVVIPTGVESINNWVFSNCKSILRVILPKGVASIGEQAFSRCTSLAELVIKNETPIVGPNAFQHCPITSAEVPVAFVEHLPISVLKTITLTGSGALMSDAFVDCTSLTTVSIKEGITRLGSRAFSGCTSLQTVTLPSSLAAIDEEVFAGSEIGKIEVASDSKLSEDSFGTRAFHNCTVTKLCVGVSTWDRSLRKVLSRNTLALVLRSESGKSDLRAGSLADCANLVALELPSLSDALLGRLFATSATPTVGIAQYTSALSNPKYYKIPTGLQTVVVTSDKSIANGAFSNCGSLTTVVLPPGCHIGDFAFAGCTNLETVYSLNSDTPALVATVVGHNAIPAGIKEAPASTILRLSGSIGYAAFEGCTGISKVELDIDGTTPLYIAPRAFYGCINLEEVTGIPVVAGSTAHGYIGYYISQEN